MPHRHPAPPRIWLMTDERMGEGLWEALERLPRGAGIVFRHYSLPLAERSALFARVARVAARRRLILLRAGNVRLARREQGVHGRQQHATRGLRSWPAHNRPEIVAGQRAGADLVFVSPIFPTRSHPDGKALGRVRALMLMRGIDARFIAMGGIEARNALSLMAAGFYGWAAIDAWLKPRT